MTCSRSLLNSAFSRAWVSSSTPGICRAFDTRANASWASARDMALICVSDSGSGMVAPPDPERPIKTLSGGNQQKAVLARWLLGSRRLLLLDEPTRGVDVGARAEMYAGIRQLADQGIGVLLVSSEVPEVLGLVEAHSG